MLYALWTIAGLLAMILLVLIVMHRDYNPVLSTLYSELHSGLNLLHQAVMYNSDTINSELSKQTDEITSDLRDITRELRDLRPKLIDAIENIGADGTRVGGYLGGILDQIYALENHTAMIALNTEPHLPSV
jgi:hypothetical protein